MNKPRNNLRNLKIIVYCIVEGINNVTETKMLRGLSKDQQKYCFKIFPSHPDINHMYSLATSKASLCKKDDFVAILIDSDSVSNPTRLSNIITANEKNKNKKIRFFVSDPCFENYIFSFFQKASKEKDSKKMGNLVSRYIPHYMKCDDCNYYVRLPQREKSVDHKKAISNYRIGIGKKSYYTIADFFELIIS